MACFAHSGTPGDKSDWQSLAEHSLAVAKRAAGSARRFGLDKAAYVAGLFHHLGKYDPDFQRRLEGANPGRDRSAMAHESCVRGLWARSIQRCPYKQPHKRGDFPEGVFGSLSASQQDERRLPVGAAVTVDGETGIKVIVPTTQ